MTLGAYHALPLELRGVAGKPLEVSLSHGCQLPRSLRKRNHYGVYVANGTKTARHPENSHLPKCSRSQQRFCIANTVCAGCSDMYERELLHLPEKSPLRRDCISHPSLFTMLPWKLLQSSRWQATGVLLLLSADWSSAMIACEYPLLPPALFASVVSSSPQS
jgi:hypothetical protein